MASRKERLNNTDPFGGPGSSNDRPALSDLTGSMLSYNDDAKRIVELEEQLEELKKLDPENAIVVRQDGMSKHYKQFELRETELLIPDDTNEQDWVEIGVLLMRMQGTIQWLLGDWLVYGMTREKSGDWKGTYSRMQEIFGYELESLHTYASVCRQVPTLTRVKELSFSHHRAVTKFSENPDLQKKWLEKARENSWSAKELIAQIRASQKSQIVTKKRKPWEEKIAKLEDDFSPKKWAKFSKAERREAMTQLNALLLKLEQLGVD